jgi:hypothetical protein
MAAVNEDEIKISPFEVPILSIDNENIYPGMDTAYKNGYTPMCSSGEAMVVLPLIAVNPSEILNNKLHISFNLGDAVSAPFQFKNYDKDIYLKEYDTNNGIIASYLVNQSFTLIERRTMGRYPLVINVDGVKTNGESFGQSFTVFITVTDGIDPNATQKTVEPEDSNKEVPIPEVKVLLSKYTVSPNPAVAGEDVEVSFTILNTSKTQDITNVKINISGETTDLSPVQSSGSYFFERIRKQATETIAINLKVNQSATAKSNKLLLSISFEGEKATPYSASESILVPITRSIRLEYDAPVIASTLNAGDTIEISTNVMNLGLGTVHNVRMQVAVPGLIPEKTAFLGNVESGISLKGNVYVFVGTLDMTKGGSAEKYRNTEGVVIITYEDEFGKEYTEEFSVATTIGPPVFLNNLDEPEEDEPKNQAQWWISIIILGGIIVAMLGVRFYIKKRKANSETQEDEGEENSGHEIKRPR